MTTKRRQYLLVFTLILFVTGLGSALKFLFIDQNVLKAALFAVVWVLPTGVWFAFTYRREAAAQKSAAQTDD